MILIKILTNRLMHNKYNREFLIKIHILYSYNPRNKIIRLNGTRKLG